MSRTLKDFFARKKGGEPRKPRLGSGKRFAALKEELQGKKGATNPGGLAAWIGRRKHGKEKFQALSKAGRKE